MSFRNKILILFAIGAWLLPALANASLPVAPRSLPLVPADKTGTSVNIVAEQPSIASVSVASRSQSLSCGILNTNAAATLVQDQMAVNLNQPANCFSLSPGQIAVQQTIALVHSEFQASVKVVSSGGAYILAYRLTPYIPDFSFLILPLSNFAFPLIAVAGVLALPRKKIRKIISRYKKFLALSQLQVMRC